MNATTPSPPLDGAAAVAHAARSAASDSMVERLTEFAESMVTNMATPEIAVLARDTERALYDAQRCCDAPDAPKSLWGVINQARDGTDALSRHRLWPLLAGQRQDHREKYGAGAQSVNGGNRRTHERDSSPVRAGQSGWCRSRLADRDTTLALYMGLHSLAEISANLIAAGLARDTPAAAIEQGTTVRQRRLIGTLATLPGLIRAAAFQPPTLIVIGRVVSLAHELDWISRDRERDWDVTRDFLVPSNVAEGPAGHEFEQDHADEQG